MLLDPKTYFEKGSKEGTDVSYNYNIIQKVLDNCQSDDYDVEKIKLCTVIHCPDGVEVIKHIDHEHLLIFMDCQMPIKNGE